MDKRLFHLYNIIVVLMLAGFNLLVLFAYGIGEGRMRFADWFPIVFSFVIWGVFYFIQFSRPGKKWRLAFFLVMIVLLYVWETGLGSFVGRNI